MSTKIPSERKLALIAWCKRHDGLVLSCACPTCPAHAGEPCVTVSGWRTAFHRARVMSVPAAKLAFY